jgi:protein FAM50
MSKTPGDRTPNEELSDSGATLPKKKFGPRSGVTFVPKVRTKAALIQEAQTREKLRKEFLALQEAVKNTEMMVPFVFYDGTNTPGGICKVKKGDHIWLFLDKARKVGAELGVGGDRGRREWARVSVDDLMLVKGEIIIPHVCSPILSTIFMIFIQVGTNTHLALRIPLLHHEQDHRFHRPSLPLLLRTHCRYS